MNKTLRISFFPEKYIPGERNFVFSQTDSAFEKIASGNAL